MPLYDPTFKLETRRQGWNSKLSLIVATLLRKFQCRPVEDDEVFSAIKRNENFSNAIQKSFATQKVTLARILDKEKEPLTFQCLSCSVVMVVLYYSGYPTRVLSNFETKRIFFVSYIAKWFLAPIIRIDKYWTVNFAILMTSFHANIN